MNTTTAVNQNEIVDNLYQIAPLTLIKLAATGDLDAMQFVTRYVRYLTLITKASGRTADEQAELERMLGAIVRDYTNEEFRKHLSEVLNGLPE